MHTDYALTPTQPQMHTEPHLKGRMQGGDTLGHGQRAVWSSPCRCSPISLVECHEFSQFVKPAFLRPNTEKTAKAMIHKSAVTLAAGCVIPF